MSKTKAHIIILFIDMLAILVFWIGYHEINQVVDGIAHSVDSVKLNNRVGFFFIGIGVLIVHLSAIYEYFWPKVVEKKMAWFNWSAFALLMVLFASAFFISARVRTHVERAGYLHCPKADNSMTFCTYLVYTKDDAICDRLVAEKRESFYKRANR